MSMDSLNGVPGRLMREMEDVLQPTPPAPRRQLPPVSAHHSFRRELQLELAELRARCDKLEAMLETLTGMDVELLQRVLRELQRRS